MPHFVIPLRKTRLVLLMCLCCNILVSPASAEEKVISEISKNGYNVINHLNRSSVSELTALDAQKIKRAILANAIVDDGEALLLKYLLAGQSFTIKSNRSGSNDLSFNKSVSDSAKTILRTVTSASFDDPMEEQWMRGDEADLKQLIEIYGGSTPDRRRLLIMIGKPLKDAMLLGEFKDQETKMKSVMARWMAKLSKLRGPDYNIFKKMLFEAAVIVDRRNSLSSNKSGDKTNCKMSDGGVPDYIYRHLMPDNCH
ncbi:hypothetical protein A8B75_04255 [Sphingomonadales bacterium EhC05]|nr:hypothetical protein A8B75_04255 [Sphingomonadales bacterium EhC05]